MFRRSESTGLVPGALGTDRGLEAHRSCPHGRGTVTRCTPSTLTYALYVLFGSGNNKPLMRARPLRRLLDALALPPAGLGGQPQRLLGPADVVLHPVQHALRGGTGYGQVYAIVAASGVRPGAPSSAAMQP